MCGRFTFLIDEDELMRLYGLEYVPELEQSYNTAPSQQITAIVHDGEKNRAGKLRWGLVPSFAKDEKIGWKMINARSETVHEKPSFKKLFYKRRCIIPADSFYEWKRENNEKLPYRIRLSEEPVMSLAGLWDRWEAPDGSIVQSCTILTTEANSLMEDIHDRMPVILDEAARSIWLDRSVQDTEKLRGLLTPYPAEKMEAYRVPQIVNSPKHNGPECIEPAG
ncbi:SOS response-associated peptidase [Bacillus daqingensis]|uniref:Abasic site processing protein n=1 Tax=Bacillus daqingensis TaxID=872396 RepID=A0ABV9NRT9_9BACI